MSLNTEIELIIRQEISSARMAEDVKAIIKDSPRHAGTYNEWKAAKYVEGEFRKNNLDVRFDKIPGVNKWLHYNTSIKIVEPI